MKNKMNLKILIPIIILCIISLLNMYGASFTSVLYKNAFKRQLIFIIMGILIFFIIYKTNFKKILDVSLYFYIVGIISLILVLFVGKNINGASSWFKIGSLSFQPSELFKIFYLVFVSKILIDSKRKKFLKGLVLTIIPSFLIFLEPDTGVVIMYLVMFFGIIINSDIKKRGLIICTVILFFIMLSTGLIYYFNKNIFVSIFGTNMFYRIERILDFKNNTSYQLSKALIGVGSAGLLGHGLTSRKVYIPEATTDFVYDLTICNFGVIGGIVILIIYIYLLYNIYLISNKTNNKYIKILASGIFYLLLYSVFEHILMNLGITPITGITLPFLSYGGSSLISMFGSIALIIKKTTNKSSYN